MVSEPLEPILATLPVPVVLHAGDGRILDANAAARRLLRSLPLRAAARLEAAAARAARGEAGIALRLAAGSGGAGVHASVAAAPASADVRAVSVLQPAPAPTAPADERLALLSELARSVASDTGTAAGLLDTIARRAAEVLGEMCIVTLLSRDRRTLRVASAHHRAEAGLAEATRELFALRPYPADRGAAGSVLATRRALRMTVPAAGAPAAPLTEADAAYLRRFGVQSWAIAPVVARGQALGTLGVWRTLASPPFAEADLEFLQQLADIGATAIAIDRLQAEARRRADRLHAVHLGQSAAGSGQHALSSLLDQLTRSAGLESAFVAQADPEAPERLLLKAASGPAPVGAVWQVSAGSPVAHAMRTGVAATIDLPPALLGRQHDGGAPAYVSPLVVQGRCLGVLAVVAGAEVLADSEQTQFIDTMAGLAAMSLEIARVASELSRVASRREPVPSRIAPALSRSESLILPLVVAGRSNREIAASVHLSENTVKFHVGNLLQKLGARNRVEAARAALRLGLAG